MFLTLIPGLLRPVGGERETTVPSRRASSAGDLASQVSSAHHPPCSPSNASQTPFLGHSFPILFPNSFFRAHLVFIQQIWVKHLLGPRYSCRRAGYSRHQAEGPDRTLPLLLEARGKTDNKKAKPF